jgi:hypothetical protein
MTRNMRWVEYILCMVEMSNAYNILVDKPERDYLGNIDIDGKILLKCILRK